MRVITPTCEKCSSISICPDDRACRPFPRRIGGSPWCRARNRGWSDTPRTGAGRGAPASRRKACAGRTANTCRGGRIGNLQIVRMQMAYRDHLLPAVEQRVGNAHVQRSVGNAVLARDNRRRALARFKARQKPLALFFGFAREFLHREAARQHRLRAFLGRRSPNRHPHPKEPWPTPVDQSPCPSTG